MTWIYNAQSRDLVLNYWASVDSGCGSWRFGNTVEPLGSWGLCGDQEGMSFESNTHFWLQCVLSASWSIMEQTVTSSTYSCELSCAHHRASPWWDTLSEGVANINLSPPELFLSDVYHRGKEGHTNLNKVCKLSFPRSFEMLLPFIEFTWVFPRVTFSMNNADVL